MMKMNLMTYLNNVARATLAAVAAMGMMLSCESIYDYEGDCSVRLHFKYDKNLKWADAFANEVKSLRLYAFDQNGILAYEYAQSGTELANPGYSVKLDLPEGKYHLVAWCGLDNPAAAQQHFTVPQTTVGKTTLDELTCRLNRTADDLYPAISDKRLEFMFHGDLDIEMGGDIYDYTMSLTKDTNHIRIILQHLSGEDLDVSKFDFRIEDANGYYAHNNSLLADDVITYKTYDTSTGEAAIVTDDDEPDVRAMVYAKTAIADLSVGRMMADHSNSMILTISNDKGEKIATFPVIHYALLAKDYYEDAYGHRMTNQDFLDREDEYVVTLFIDENQQWYSARIFINSWRVIDNNYEMQY